MLIEPRVLKGFRDFLPEQEIERRRITHILEECFKRGGFAPIDTPVLEYSEVLLGKGGGETDKQVYRFSDHGQRDVAMRFDLTVPFARFVAQNYASLQMPFKRYHLAKVWRGENTQKGRYREFMQCDFDIVGSDSINTDFEILLLICESFEAMGIDEIHIRISHRGIFNALLSRLGLCDVSVKILRAVDKLGKIGLQEVKKQLLEICGEQHTAVILEYIKSEADFSATVKKLESLFPEGQADIVRMAGLYEMMQACGIEKYFIFDTSITRGLDYYTGIVYETYLSRAPEIGAVCSGGRYDNLASLYTKQQVPGIGASIGLDRLMAGLEGLDILSTRNSTLDIIILNMDADLAGYYHKLCTDLRSKGFSVEVYPDTRKLSAQFKYAEKKDIPLAVICGPDEKKNGVISLKDLRRRESHTDLNQADLEKKIGELLQ